MLNLYYKYMYMVRFCVKHFSFLISMPTISDVLSFKLLCFFNNVNDYCMVNQYGFRLTYIMLLNVYRLYSYFGIFHIKCKELAGSSFGRCIKYKSAMFVERAEPDGEVEAF